MDEGLRETIRKEYCPPLDDATAYAIFDDFSAQVDSIGKEQLGTIRDVLDSLKASAVAEDTADFDPSGTGGTSKDGHLYLMTGTTGSSEDASTSYDVQTLSTGLSELVLGTEPENHNVSNSNWAALDQEQKEQLLVDMFPAVHKVTVSNTIRNNKSDLKSCVDTLLNISFMSQHDSESGIEQPILKKGIDGFARDDSNRRGRIRRNRKKVSANDSTRSSSVTSIANGTSTPVRNAWLSTEEDVSFIFERTKLPEQAVRSLYHAAGTSLALTIRKLAEQEAKKIKRLEDLPTTIQVKITELTTSFPSISALELAGLLSVARDPISAPGELASEMIKKGASVEPTQIKIIPQYARPKLEDGESPKVLTSQAPYAVVDRVLADNLAAAHGEAGQEAFAQASVAAKRGRSDHLMKAAAGVYAERGHEYRAKQRGLESAVATAHVAQQSTQNMTDLHGTRVHDAVRIANERAWKWWNGLGDAKFLGDGGPANDGFRIVTGVGHHNRDGASKLGPAVWRVLVHEGWKASVGTGEILVTGRRRR